MRPSKIFRVNSGFAAILILVLVAAVFILLASVTFSNNSGFQKISSLKSPFQKDKLETTIFQGMVTGFGEPFLNVKKDNGPLTFVIYRSEAFQCSNQEAEHIIEKLEPGDRVEVKGTVYEKGTDPQYPIDTICLSKGSYIKLLNEYDPSLVSTWKTFEKNYEQYANFKVNYPENWFIEKKYHQVTFSSHKYPSANLVDNWAALVVVSIEVKSDTTDPRGLSTYDIEDLKKTETLKKLETRNGELEIKKIGTEEDTLIYVDIRKKEYTARISRWGGASSGTGNIFEEIVKSFEFTSTPESCPNTIGNITYSASADWEKSCHGGDFNNLSHSFNIPQEGSINIQIDTNRDYNKLCSNDLTEFEANTVKNVSCSSIKGNKLISFKEENWQEKSIVNVIYYKNQDYLFTSFSSESNLKKLIDTIEFK